MEKANFANGNINLEQYTVVDVETPNRHGRSICSIGLVHVDKGDSSTCIYYLVDPEDEFDATNIRIHGIRPVDIQGAPTLPQIWEEIGDWFTNGILIAHNASFDLSVIQKALERYDLPVPDLYCICTLQKSRKHIPKSAFGNHKLDTLCKGLGIQLENHHNALDDAQACACLFEYLQRHFGCGNEDIRAYWTARSEPGMPADSVSEKALNSLYGMLLGIGFDRKLFPLENDALTKWSAEQRLSQNQDVKTCRVAISSALQDGILSKQEYESLLALCDIGAMCGSNYCVTTQATQLLMGILEGIAADGIIQDEEAKRLLEWMGNYDYLKGFFPYDKVFETLVPMMADKHIDADEQAVILKCIQQILHPVCDNSGIQYNESTFCLTGNFTHGSKEDVSEMIISRGGIIAKGISKKVDYVVVGGEGSEKWAYGNYGGKVKRALELIEQGEKIEIVGEDALFCD